MLKHKNTYEIISPEDIGLHRSDESGIVLGKLRYAANISVKYMFHLAAQFYLSSVKESLEFNQLMLFMFFHELFACGSLVFCNYDFHVALENCWRNILKF